MEALTAAPAATSVILSATPRALAVEDCAKIRDRCERCQVNVKGRAHGVSLCPAKLLCSQGDAVGAEGIGKADGRRVPQCSTVVAAVSVPMLPYKK